ncbi:MULTISPECIES: DUF6759 domain-containing protein [Chryseobacterium]|uniref:DUF6759 domain-containing protein n=1 Tax=Chryseobacterium TaxID=59732 RepID=UPI001552C21B|nr:MULTISPECIES: DUF6759 domain-containing protein [unclassified Chryseobacterium]MDC8105601.1 hypothetical protein [Chryseobacterium sp. B21-037]MDQ1806372.1 hypothetical protein [Chryseobacterium sp. CKR4-1]WBV54822.1 hypothetical protein PFY10_11250 [Chryseobacterium daecheongense]
MKKIFLLIFLCIFTLGFSQKKKRAKSKAVVEKETLIIYTEQDAESSKEARVIAGFLKQNPNHAKTDYFKRKLIEIIMADNSPEAKPTIKPISKEKIEKIVKNNELNSGKTLAVNSASAPSETKVNYASVSGSKKSEPSEENKRTAAMLTHLFSNDTNLKEAYINIKNRSNCNLIVKISGKKYYNLSVPAKGQNFILIDKGEYVLTTMVCDAKYSSIKKISKDIEIELNVSE